jgi:NAD(P)-dependent dehydrogenase (short-subunit alcohol dehydrogenase family)
VASKFALEGLTDTLRMELRGTGIQVCLIEPGPILSRFRENAHRAFRDRIDTQGSAHGGAYRLAEARLLKEGPAQPFTLPPEAVLAKLVHALESPRPRPRYPVTIPSHLFWWLRRVLSTRAMDWAMARVSGSGAR